MIQRPSDFKSEEQREACGKQLEHCRKSICRMPGGEDLYQEVCLRCVRRAADRNWLEPQYGFILKKVVPQVAVDMHRRAAVREAFSAQSDVVAEAQKCKSVDEAIKQERLDLLRERLNRLSKSHRDAVVDHFFENESIQNIANKRHLPFDTVKTRIRRGVNKLRNDPVLCGYEADRN